MNINDIVNHDGSAVGTRGTVSTPTNVGIPSSSTQGTVGTGGPASGPTNVGRVSTQGIVNKELCGFAINEKNKYLIEDPLSQKSSFSTVGTNQPYAKNLAKALSHYYNNKEQDRQFLIAEAKCIDTPEKLWLDGYFDSINKSKFLRKNTQVLHKNLKNLP
jgi:hypothetical protein